MVSFDSFVVILIETTLPLSTGRKPIGIRIPACQLYPNTKSMEKEMDNKF